MAINKQKLEDIDNSLSKAGWKITGLEDLGKDKTLIYIAPSDKRYTPMRFLPRAMTFLFRDKYLYAGTMIRLTAIRNDGKDWSEDYGATDEIPFLVFKNET